MTYWRSAAEDEAMQDEHGFVWRSMLATIDVGLSGKRVLDAGCNRGGFLRLVADSFDISGGFGYDPASSAVEDARRLAGDRRLHFETAKTVPDGWVNFDVAFSHEVLYLLHDLGAHAAAMFAALTPGGIYYAVIGVHTRSALMAQWHSANAQALGLPELYDIDDVVATFEAAGFEASVARLAMTFVPMARNAHREPNKVFDWLNYYCDEKVFLRFRRQHS